MAKGFDHDSPFFDIYYPGHDTEIGQLAGSRRLLAWKKAASESSFLKATLNSTPESPNKIIGFAVWTLMEEVPSANIDELDDVNDVWPDAGDAEYIRRLWRKYVIPRSDVVASSDGAGIYGESLSSISGVSRPDFDSEAVQCLNYFQLTKLINGRGPVLGS